MTAVATLGARLLIVTVVAAVSGCGGLESSGGGGSPAATHILDCRGATEAVPTPPSPARGVSYISMTVDHKLRDYMLFTPSGLDRSKPVPLVIVFHGSPIDAAGMESYIDFDAEAEKAGFLAAWPNGCGGFWSYSEGGSKVADEDFVKKLIQQLEAQYSVDRSRVFLAGISAGTWMEYRLACDFAPLITAIASVAGTMRLSDECQPSRPVSILEMHGTNDSEHPWNGGGSHSAFPVDDVMTKWVELDGCSANPTVTQKGITVTSVWSGCQAGATVRLDKVVGGNHTWFGSSALNPVAGEPDANTTIWSFFSHLQASA